MHFDENFTSINQLVNHLKKTRYISSDIVENVMRAVDRADFTDAIYPYNDSPQSIGFGSTISAPHMHAVCLELLKDNLGKGSKALDVGSGSGYLVVCMAKLIEMNGGEGKVIGIEHIHELVEQSISNLQKKNSNYFNSSNPTQIKIIEGDGTKGNPEEGPYDAIHVGAAAHVVPKALLDQLKIGGKMVIPVGPELGYQDLKIYERTGHGTYKTAKAFGVRYVPLCSVEHQLGQTR